jgi:hypothetical protein
MIFFGISWFLWLLRNEKMFNNRIPNYDIFFLLILTRLGIWLKAIFLDFYYLAIDLLILVEGLVC